MVTYMIFCSVFWFCVGGLSASWACQSEIKRLEHERDALLVAFLEDVDRDTKEE